MDTVLNGVHHDYAVNRLIDHRIHSLVEREKINLSQFDKQVLAMLGKFGIEPSDDPAKFFFEELQSKLGISRDQYPELTVVETEIDIESHRVLREWATTGDTLQELGLYYFGRGNEQIKPEYKLISGEKVPLRFTSFSKYDGEPIVIKFKRYNEEKWEVEAVGSNAEAFLKELEERTANYLVKKFRGKIIDQEKKPVSIRLYEFDKMVYPPKLEEVMRQLIQQFDNWSQSELVNRWGCLLIGKRGTGKTSIGGLLAARKPKDCTFIYVPAGMLRRVDQINQAFQLAETLAPSILQIDDIDLISRAREEADSGSSTSVLMELLQGLRQDKKVFTLFTTNDPSRIEEAIINRAGRIFSKILLEGYVDCCGDLIRRYASEFSLSIDDSAIEQALEACKKESDLTPDEVKNLCERLHLKFMHRKRAITAVELAEEIRGVHDAFYNMKYEKPQHVKKRGRIGVPITD